MRSPFSKRRIVVSLKLACGGLLSILLTINLASAEDESSKWPFFAFDNGVGRGEMQPERQAEMLADLGYQGIGYTGIKNLPDMLQSLDKHGLKMFSTYVGVSLKPGKAPYEPDLPKAIKQLSGHRTDIWIHVHGLSEQSAAQDQRAVEVIREIADMATTSGLRVVLYPHVGNYVATTSDAVRLVKQVNRANVGASFNLCHFLKQNDERDLNRCLNDAMPYLFLVSINGADSGDTQEMKWDQLIQTLDRGSFDVGRVLKLLQAGGYSGPIGLQSYAITGDIRQNLERSITAWQKLRGGFDSETNTLEQD